MIELTLPILSNRPIAAGICEMVLQCETVPAVKPGQFLHVRVPGKTLRRPFGIVRAASKSITFAYAVLGEGTALLSQMTAGTAVDVLLPLGNGFPVEDYQKILILTGGLGLLPLIPVVETPGKTCVVAAGFQSIAKVVYADAVNARADLTLFSDDGSIGIKGFPAAHLGALVAAHKPDAVFACGPARMLMAVQAAKPAVPTFVSLERRMACGVGACMVCTCRIAGRHARICAEGPVFPVEEVEEW
ncbi:MAG: dihydroorotate dehydrogenase electron transfer subunit [Clostridiales bacterium]|jgi:dihydroorotate dehydrogenase electron transfer subunit|nr:dihydroorotate dehydrogenase electron transfer subunit [Clostridiales bacterium]